MMEVGPLQGVGDFHGADRAVEVAFVVGVGLDGDALPGQFGGQGLQAGQPGLLDGLQLGPVLLHHPLVVVGGDRGQALRNQVVQGVAVLHLDHVALLAEMFDRLDQQQLDAAVRSLGQPLAFDDGNSDFFDFSVGHD